MNDDIVLVSILLDLVIAVHLTVIEVHGHRWLK